MTQQSERRAFEEAKTPGWLRDVTRFVHGIKETNAYDEAAAAGAQMTEVFFGDARYVKYRSKLVPSDPSLPEDFMSKEIAQYKKRGIRVLAVVWPCYQAKMYKEHPDWRHVATKTDTIPESDAFSKDYGGLLCLIGPWGDYLIEIMAEIMTLYPEVDGFCFDGLQHAGVCCCRHCREAYLRDTGSEIPDRNMNDPEFRRYQLWADRQIEKLVDRMQKRIKSIKPDAVLVPWTTNSGRMMQLGWIPHPMSARTNLLFDAPAMELWLDETHLGNSIVPAFSNAYLWALTNFRVAFSEPYLMTHFSPYSTDSFPPHEEMRRVLQVITYGCRPNHALSWPNHKASALDCVREIARRSQWMTDVEPERWAGIVMSDQTRTFYGRDGAKVEQRYLSNVFGAFRAAVEEHLATNIVTDWQLNPADLARYKVLIMPNTACLSDEQARCVEQFVRNGGGLVATVDTSLFDELGNARNDFALADVFGVHYLGIPGPRTIEKLTHQIDGDYWDKLKIVADFRMGKHELLVNERLRQYCADNSVVYKGQAAAVGAIDDDAKVVATFTPREREYEPMAEGTTLPGMVVRTHGKGRVVYIPVGLDSGYFLYPFTYQRLVLAQAVRWAAAAPQPITVEAPMCVQATFMRQRKNGERLIVHLFNDLNTSGNHARPDQDVPQREEVIPIGGIKISFHGYALRRVHLEPEGVALKMEKSGSETIVKVPELKMHSMVVAELEQ